MSFWFRVSGFELGNCSGGNALPSATRRYSRVQLCATVFHVGGFGGGGWFFFVIVGAEEAFVVFGPGEFGPAAAIKTILEAGEVADEVVEVSGAVFAAKFVEGIKVGHEFGDGDAGEVFKEIAGFGSLQCGAGFGDALDAGFAGLIRQPILVATVAPVGEVGFGDRLVIEFFGEKFFGLGEAIQPAEEFGALLAVLEAAVELVADGFGELGDFAEAGGHKSLGV